MTERELAGLLRRLSDDLHTIKNDLTSVPVIMLRLDKIEERQSALSDKMQSVEDLLNRARGALWVFSIAAAAASFVIYEWEAFRTWLNRMTTK